MTHLRMAAQATALLFLLLALRCLQLGGQRFSAHHDNGLLIVVVSGIIKRFDDNNVDAIFWLGISFTVFLLVVIFLLIIKISQRTKEIKEL